MGQTPEGKVKAAVKKVLDNTDKYGSLYQYWPVPAGFGAPTLDCLVCYRGVFISIETKAPGKKPTARQELSIEDITEAGGIVLVIDTTDTTVLEQVLNAICKRYPQKEGPAFRGLPGRRKRNP